MDPVTAPVAFVTGALAPGRYVVRLRVGAVPETLDRATLVVHGPIVAPSVDSPADVASVSSSHPELCVNNASSASGATLSYEFALYRDASLQQPMPGVSDVEEGDARTCWRVATNLAENSTFHWRARAADGFSSSPWTAVASFLVDAENAVPDAPVPDRPRPDERVTTFQPDLVVANSFDPDFDTLTYELRVATDPDLTQIVTSTAGLPEPLDDFTTWRVPVPLDENATYYWAARSSDGTASSPWSATIAFVVDTTNDPAAAPVLLRPADGSEVTTLVPELAVANSADPRGACAHVRVPDRQRPRASTRRRSRWQQGSPKVRARRAGRRRGWPTTPNISGVWQRAMARR